MMPDTAKRLIGVASKQDVEDPTQAIFRGWKYDPTDEDAARRRSERQGAT